MRVGVIGSRTLKDREWAWTCLDHQLSAVPEKLLTIVSGDARGADSIGREWAEARGYDYKGWPAQWKFGGKLNLNAGFDRNHQIVWDSDFGIAFWDGKSNGTRHAISLYKAAGKHCVIHYFNPSTQQTNDLTSLFE